MAITANQVTIARILLLPVPTGLVLWGHPAGLIAALFIGTAIGATDALDGYLARRDGPTTLGALLDPTADKLFMAAMLLAIGYREGYCPPWIIAGILCREFLITGLRTSMAVREASIKTSLLGKLKTVVQMGGLLVFFFTAAVITDAGATIVVLSENGVSILHGVGSVGCMVTVGLFYLVKKRWLPFWLVGIGPIWFMLFLISLAFERHEAVFAIFLAMLVITWLSGGAYIRGAWAKLRETGWTQPDRAIVFWAVFTPLPSLLVQQSQWILIPILLSIAAELCTSGIDNIAAAENKRRAGALQYFIPGLLGLTLVSVAFSPFATPMLVTILAWLQTLVSVAILFRAYSREKGVFANES